jgi:hypothetical protein
MTQVGEAVAVDLAGSDSSKCPFNCGSTCDATNVFTRVEKMGGSMTSGEPTIRYKQVNFDYKNDTTPIDAKYPPKQSSFRNDWGWAAHHLIPVGSLKDHKLRKYLDKGFNGSKVSCDAGYNVNGVTNGKWLVGSGQMQVALQDEDIIAAVKRECLRAGIKVGKSLFSSLTDDARSNPSDPLKVRAWLFATMAHYGLQYHDSHSATDGYNDFVEQILNKIHANLARLEQECPGGTKCKAAGEKPKAPHRIARRLDFVSKKLERLVQGQPSTWKRPVFTSAFSRMLAEEVHSDS